MSFFPPFFVPAGCGWDLNCKCKYDLTQNAFLTPSLAAAEHDVIELKKIHNKY